MAKSNSSSPFMCMKGPTDSRTSIFLEASFYDMRQELYIP